LSYNQINDYGGELLVISLETNTSLQYLSLKRNNLKDSMENMFTKLVKKGKNSKIRVNQSLMSDCKLVRETVQLPKFKKEVN